MVGSLSEARALLILRGLPGVGDVTLNALLAAFGSGEEALDAPRSAFADVAGAAAAAAREAGVGREDVDRALIRCEEVGVEVVPRGGEVYPDRLLHLAAPPPVLFLRGDRNLLERPTVTVVGSRKSTAYGRRAATEIVRELVAVEVVVASGLALGIDGAAHRAALEVGGSTLAVLGTGPDVSYPRTNRGLFRRIAREGLLVTEFLPGTGPQPHHFPRRNRILAALARAVVVVEAARRSGALITADLALELGRGVGAVPGSIYAAQSEGANRLVRVGAHPLVAPTDVLELVPGLADRVEPREPPGPPAGVDPDARTVWELMGAGPADVDVLTRSTGLPPARTLAALSTLEMAGWVRKEAGMRFVRIRPAPPP